MKYTTFTMALMMIGLSFTASAASLRGSMSHEAMISEDSIPRISVGLDLELLERDLELSDGTTGRLRANSLGPYLGVDVTPWFTVFGTWSILDVEEVDVPGGDAEYEDDLRWSIGAAANLWQTDIDRPDAMSGRVSIRASLEYTSYDATSKGINVDWTEFAIALPFGYELYNERTKLSGVYSLLLFAGPLYSSVEGDVDGSVPSVSFDESENWGLLAGTELFLAENVSLTGQIHYFDQVSGSFAGRYHF
jgi:hypothetical protein